MKYLRGIFCRPMFLSLLLLLWQKSLDMKHIILTMFNCTVQWH